MTVDDRRSALERRLAVLAAQVAETESRTRQVVRLAGLVAVLVGVALGTPRPALSGPGLAVSVLTVFAAAAYLHGAVAGLRGGQHRLHAVAVLGAAGAALAGLTAGAAVAFPLVAAYSAGRLAGAVPGAVATLAEIAVFLGVGLGTGHPIGDLSGVAVGMVAVLLVGLNQTGQQRIRAEQAAAAALDERARIAREIHDVLAHSLAGLAVQLETAALLLDKGAEPARVAEHVDRARGLTRTGMEETRRALQTLRGAPLPVPEVLAELATAHGDETGTPPTVTVLGTVRALEPELTLCLCRVAQEALANARRHAAGAPVTVTLAYPPPGPDPAIVLTVTNPAGETASGRPAGSGYGLIGMAERAALLGGNLDAAPDPAGGWRVELRLPL